MKEDNEYYTPEIEEFHPGFEYECKASKNVDWFKNKASINDLNDVEQEIQLGLCRVKHLDKEDKQNT